MNRPISIRGNRTIFQNTIDTLGERDILTGVYKYYVEYYINSTEDKFIEVKLAGHDPITLNYLKAIYNRYNITGNLVETKTIDLIYEGNILIDIDNVNINNDFYPTDRLEEIINTMVNIGSLANQDNRIETLEQNLNAIVNGNVETPKEPGLSLDVFVDVTESKEISVNDYGKILKCDNADTPIVLTIPLEEVDPENPEATSVSASSFTFIKTGVANVTLSVAEGVTLLQPTPAGSVQSISWIPVQVMRVEVNKWLVMGVLTEGT